MEVGKAQEGSSSSCRHAYRVFLSHRRKGAGKTFTDHLYTALVHAGIHTFKGDDEELEIGENIMLQMEKAIEQSSVSIIVFSKHYIASRKCLGELLKIQDCKKTKGHKVLPVFYDVHPAQVREQAESLAEAFLEHDQLKSALEEATVDLEGKVLQRHADGYESKFIQEIVKEVGRKLNRVALDLPCYLVGINDRAKYINLWLQDESNDIVIGVIYGMGGIGKTTIAKSVYNSNFNRFEGSSFLARVRETSMQPNGLVRLQRQLLSNLLKGRKVKIYSADEGITKIKDAICCKKVLIVLDDVDDVEQLDAIFGLRNWFYPGSKIIVTTRNENLLKVHDKYMMYEIMKLDDAESVKLFSWHAFGQDHPIEDYMKLSGSIAQHCGGIPLALQVLGSSLHCVRSIKVWESKLEKLKAIPDNKVQRILEISFKSLDDDHDKNLFLHIACFFVGMNKDYVVKILDACGFYTTVGTENLTDRCLLEIHVGNKLVMHELVRDMGREIVRQESPKEPCLRSRLWHYKDSFNVLREKTGTEHIQGLILDMHMFKEDGSSKKNPDGDNAKRKHFQESRGTSLKNAMKRHRLDFSSWLPLANSSTYVFTDAFAGMENLKLIQLNYVKLSGSYKEFPNKLRWLCWHGFPLKSIPCDFPLESLVALDLRHSSLTRFYEGSLILGSLKILNLSHSHKLSETPDFLSLPCLEKLMLKNCTSLVEVHESIGDLERLVSLDLRDCKNLKQLPRELCRSKSLQKLALSGCSKLEKLPADLKEMTSLMELHVDRTTTNHELQSISRVPNSWHSFFFSWLSKPRKSPDFSCISFPCSLVKLKLWDCNLSDDLVPWDLSSMPMLMKLDLGTNPIKSLPQSIKYLTKLQTLRLDFCTDLHSLPELPLSLKGLNLENCTSLKRITNVPNYGRSLNLELSYCTQLVEIQGKFKLEPIENVDANIINQLGLNDMQCNKNFEVELYKHMSQEEVKGRVQVLYEFGIFSSFFVGNIPGRFNIKNAESSLNFTVPSLPNHKIVGLNVCVVYALLDYDRFWVLAENYLKINNHTKGQIWTYDPMCLGIPTADEDMLWMSHWQFTNQLENGDEMGISVNMARSFQVKQCGVQIVFGKVAEKTKTELENQGDMDNRLSITSYQNNISDGDLSAYQMSTGEFLLCNHDCMLHQKCSGDMWTNQEFMEITWLTDEEEDENEE